MNYWRFNLDGYHNRHIRFGYDGLTFSGVVFDDACNTEGKSRRSDYTFVQTGNLRAYKDFERAGDRPGMASVSSIIDAAKIVWAEKI